MKITKEYFELKVGCPAEDDDIDRCNCEMAGESGHFSCGWCGVCDQPQFICGCYVKQSVLVKSQLKEQRRK